MDNKANTASQTLNEVFSCGETKVIDAGKIDPADHTKKSGFVKSLESMSANDIADPQDGRKKKRITADFVTRLIAFLVCFGVFGASLYMVVERVIDDIQAQRLMEDLQQIVPEREVPRMNQVSKLSSSHTLFEALDSDGADSPVEVDTSVDYDIERMRLLAAVEMNPDVYGWIRINGTVINYPILKADDNDYYLYRDINLNYSKSGSIFADFRLSDKHSDNYNALFYGHCMSNGSMFRYIMQWFEAYQTRDSVADTMEIEIITVDGVYVYEVFSAYRSTGTHFITASFANENEYLDFLKEIRSKTVLRRRVPYNADSRICTLVTCTNVVGMEDERYVLHGILKKIVLYG